MRGTRFFGKKLLKLTQIYVIWTIKEPFSGGTRGKVPTDPMISWNWLGVNLTKLCVFEFPNPNIKLEFWYHMKEMNLL